MITFLSKKETVAQLQIKILPLTNVLKDYMYTFERAKRTEERNAYVWLINAVDLIERVLTVNSWSCSGANAKRRLAFPRVTN